MKRSDTQEAEVALLSETNGHEMTMRQGHVFIRFRGPQKFQCAKIVVVPVLVEHVY